MNRDLPTPPAGDSPSRWRLIGDLIAFQARLVIDALRDLILGPAALIAGLVDLLSPHELHSRHFYSVLHFGCRTERWINLFGAVEHDEQSVHDTATQNFDQVVQRLEKLLVEQYERGGLTAAAKNAIDRSLDGLVKAGKKRHESA